MSDAPVSPKANRLASPSWLDTRLVLGVLLVLVSVVVGASVLSAADARSVVYTVTRDMAEGSTLLAGDLEPVRVQLEDAELRRLLQDLPGDADWEGYVANRPLNAGELVPLAALAQAGDVEQRQVTLNIEPGHAPPDLRKGDLVDVYVTPEETDAAPAPVDPGASPGPTQVPLQAGLTREVLRGVPVERAGGEDDGGFSSAADQARQVVLNLAPNQVRLVLSAVAEGRIDLVRVRTRRGGVQQEQAAEPTPTPEAG